jgi:hypothetical protein
MMLKTRYKIDRPGEVRPLSSWERLAIATGYDPLGMFNPPLEDDPERWRELWEQHRGGELSGVISGSPGERPEAWWRWEAPGEPAPGETIPEFLGRHGLISEAELREMWVRLIERMRHNRGRKPARSAAGYFTENFLPFTDADRYAWARPVGGLTDEEQRLVDDLDPAALEIRD